MEALRASVRKSTTPAKTAARKAPAAAGESEAGAATMPTAARKPPRKVPAVAAERAKAGRR
jgi:hypothetical protein